MKRAIAIAMALAGCLTALTANAAEQIDKDYVRSLAAPGRTVLVVEYYDGEGKISQREGYSSQAGYKALSPTDIRVTQDITLHLYGLEPCEGEFVNRAEGYAGSCADFAQEQLQIMLNNPRVLFCRAFITEINAPRQNATCYGYYFVPGAMDAVDMLEEQLVSLGAMRLARRPDGTPLRPDLSEAEEIGRNTDLGMWADPRVAGEGE